MLVPLLVGVGDGPQIFSVYFPLFLRVLFNV